MAERIPELEDPKPSYDLTERDLSDCDEYARRTIGSRCTGREQMLAGYILALTEAIRQIRKEIKP